MSSTHDFGAETIDGPNSRLVDARDAFIEAQRALEAARHQLLHAHAESTRLISARSER